MKSDFVTRKLLTLLFFLLVLSSVAFSDNTALDTVFPDERVPLDRDLVDKPAEGHLFGNWTRTPMKYGIEPSLTWVTDIQGNPYGGIHQSLREFDNLNLAVKMNLQTLVNAPGTTFFMSASQRSGTSLTNLDIGNLFNISQLCCGATYRLVDMYLEQPFYDDHFNLRFGRIATGDEFLSSPIYWLFVQNGIDGNPVGIFKNSPGMSAYPKGTWGVRARFQTKSHLYLMAGLYNGDPTLGQNYKHGLDWSMHGPLFAITEAGFHRNPEGLDSRLPGSYKVGFFYDNNLYKNFLYDATGGAAPLTGMPNRIQRGNNGFYFLLEQMVYRKGGPGSKIGITPFFSVLISPNQAISMMPTFINGGVTWQGLFPSRANDIAGLGIVYGSISNQLQTAQNLDIQNGVPGAPSGVQKYELVIEAMYIIQAKSWLKIQPNLQYIFQPGGTGLIPDALVTGAQISITL